MNKIVVKSGATKLFWLIIVPVCVLSTLFATIICIFAISYQKAHLLEQLISRSRLIIGTAQNVSQVMGNNAEFRRIISSLGGADDVDTVVVASGFPLEVIAATKNMWVNLPVDQISVPYISAAEFSKVIDSDQEVVRIEGDLFLNVSLPIELFDSQNFDEPYTKSAMFLRFDLTRINQTLDIFRNRVIAASLFFTCFSVLIFGVLFRKLVNQPLNHLLSAIQNGSGAEAINSSAKFMASEFEIVITSFAKLLSDDRQNRELLTERNKLLEDSNRELIAKNELISAIVENIPVAVFLKDIKDDFRVTVWNNAAERIFEVPREAILGKSAHDLWPKDQADLYLAADRRVVDESILVDIPEEPSHSKTRGTIFLRTRKLPLAKDFSKRARYLLCICDDITDRKRIQESLDLERTKSLRNAKLASLGEMAAGIAHEINNPLMIIYGTVRALSKFTNNPEQLATRIESIQVASERIAKIVRSLRKFSRTSDRSDYKFHSLRDIVKEALVLTDAKARRHFTRVGGDYKSECRVFCDEIEMEQVFVNMINNAIDAVQNLSEKWVMLELQESDGRIVVRIRDSGPRIGPDIQKKLFQPFFTTKPVGEGTGLGLSIVKGILDEHHATIELVADDLHTCFEIHFPKAEVKKDAA